MNNCALPTAVYRKLQKELEAAGWQLSILNFYKLFFSFGVPVATMRAMEKFLAGTESVVLSDFNALAIDNDQVLLTCSDGRRLLLEHKQLFVFNYWRHWYRVTEAIT